MKYFKFLGIAALLMVLSIGLVSATVLPNATLETQGVSTSTVIQCDGITMNSNSLSMEQTNQALDGAPLKTGEDYAATAYNANMIALTGSTQFVKTVNVNNKNSIISGKNVDVATDLVYSGANGGFIVGDETLAQFNAGASGTKTGDVTLCPFTSTASSTIPPFNTAVSMGSHYDLYSGNVASQASAVTTAGSADIGTNTQYAISSTGVGSISTYMDLFSQDARGDGKTLITPAKTTTTPAVLNKYNCVVTPAKTVTTPAVYSAVTPSSEISYSEKSSANGRFTFAKTMGFTSSV